MAKENNKDRILKLLKECKNHQTAESIAVQLNIQRNTASGILNEFVREGIVQKEKTRPVIFSYIQPEDQLPEDPFTTFIGADQSLKDAVEKCKLSAGYPNKGMPILLFGSSGVGKSLLAEYIYQYAKFIGTIPEDAPFVVLNCADYANNKELLSSVLFGYKKGAFTGANKDTKGLIEEADKGYLFLDEVHRLSPEGQEKLFRYMDKGIISRMGDSGQNCELNVRLIFATTEGRETMLDTFLRRIPVDVVLPDFQERTLEEKYELILFLIHQESKTMNTTFQVSSNVINRLLTFQGKGNIGTLKNIIRLSCAKAYNERSKGQEVIPLNLSHLSSDTLLHGNGESIPYINEMIEVSPDQDAVWKISMTEQADVDFSEKVINDLIQEYLEKDISTIKFRKIIYDEVNRIEDIVIDQEIHPYVQNLYTQAVRNILIYLQDNYGLKYSGVMEMVFETYIFEAFDMEYDTPKKDVVKRIKRYLKNTNTSKGLLIFVDMGSLLDISEDIKDDVEGDLGIVNNITTEMALEAGELILKHEDLQNIMDTIIEHHVTKKSFVPSKQKPKAILLCCTTGLGTTDKMKMLLQGCLEGIDIDVVEMTYAELSTEGNRCDVFRKYDIQFIITTSKLMIQGVTTLMLNELIDERGEKVIYSTVGRYCDKDKTQRFIENIVRSFTIKNLIGQLTILNPDKIMGDVEETVSKLEILEDTTYSIDQKKMLYIHMCVMVERLILEKGRLPQEDMTDDLKCRESFIKNLKESFSVIENKYNVSLNEREILMIYYLTENN